MKVNGFQNIPAVLQSFQTDKSTQASTENGREGSSASVSLSSFAEVLQSLQRESAKSAGLRGSRVEDLAQQAQTGKLTVDPSKLAARLVDLQVIDLEG